MDPPAFLPGFMHSGGTANQWMLERSPSSRFYCVRGFYSRWAMDLVMQHMDAGETFSMPFGKAERRHTAPSNLKRVPCASADPCLPCVRAHPHSYLSMHVQLEMRAQRTLRRKISGARYARGVSHGARV